MKDAPPAQTVAVLQIILVQLQRVQNQRTKRLHTLDKPCTDLQCDLPAAAPHEPVARACFYKVEGWGLACLKLTPGRGKMAHVSAQACWNDGMLWRIQTHQQLMPNSCTDQCWLHNEHQPLHACRCHMTRNHSAVVDLASNLPTMLSHKRGVGD